MTDSKKKILIISTVGTETVPRAYGGMEQISGDQAREMDRLGWEVTLIASKDSARNFKDTSIRVIETVSPGIPSIPEPQSFRVWKDLVKIDDFDVVQDHTHMAHVYSLLKPQTLKTPDGKEVEAYLNNNIVKTIHTEMPWSGPPCAYWPPGPHNIIPNPNLVAVSKSLADYLSHAWGCPMAYVHNGIDISRYPYQEEKGERALFLGRISSIKGVTQAITAALCAGVDIDIAGADDHGEIGYLNMVKKLVRQNPDKVKYWGKVTHATKVRLLQNAKCLLAPSQFLEPFGLMVAEAGACGTPAIVTARGGLTEIVSGTGDHKTGYVCDSYDRMVTAIGRSDKVRPEDCRHRIETLFTVQTMTANYISLYTGMGLIK
jgi:glycosyltransferase involved in cell wall biosynthesis